MAKYTQGITHIKHNHNKHVYDITIRRIDRLQERYI